MDIKDITKAIKRAEQKTGGRFMSWDVGKWITEETNTKSTISFDVIHEDELDRDERRTLYRFVDTLEEELLGLPGIVKSETGFDGDIEVPFNAEDLEKAFYALCQSEHKAVWGRRADEDELDGFSVFVEY